MRNVEIAVIGGGITGQLVQFLLPDAVIFDWRKSGERRITRDYGANYLWEPLAGIPCRSFPVVTTIDGAVPTYESATLYKAKIGKSSDMADGWERQFPHTSTGYDFIGALSARIEYEHRVVEIRPISRLVIFAGQEPVQYRHLVSTIPLYSLLSLMGIREPIGRLKFKPIFAKVTARPPDAPYPLETMYVNYITSPTVAPYRFTDRDGQRHFESIVPFDGRDIRRLTPGKIYAHPGVPETLDILAGMGVKTFGRYGSWNPDELIHETWHSIIDWKTQCLGRTE